MLDQRLGRGPRQVPRAPSEALIQRRAAGSLRLVLLVVRLVLLHLAFVLLVVLLAVL